jgi:serine phosphatase RsbU (regulator of sigma subunit)/anti-sigma regulatory factor (Ser/Thr protein kinase)
LRGEWDTLGVPTRGAADDDAADRDCLDNTFPLTDEAGTVRAARHFVTERARTLVPELAEDAALVAAELLANAQMHGAPPVVVRISGGDDRLRIEVQDASSRSPIKPTPSTTNMTGRGLALVQALSHAWGVRREPGGGKSVWCELMNRQLEQSAGDLGDDSDIDAILAQWDDEPEVGSNTRFTVVLGDVPTDLLLDAKAHIDNVVREFTLAGASQPDGEEIPVDLQRLINTVVNGFADARAAIKRQALAAAERGEPRTRLVLNLPATAADAGEAYLAALDEADDYARAARLLTLATPPDHRLFRQWYVNAIIEQIRGLAAGRALGPVVPFEQMLVAEVRRLAEAQRVSERGARLQRVTAALARARTPSDVAGVVVSVGVNTLGASGGGLLVPAGDGEHLSVPGAVGYGEELVGQLREERIDAPLPAATALRTSEPIWLESQEERDERFPELRGFESRTISMCAVPLIVGDRTLGALRFSFDTRKLFDDDERAFVLALAAQTALTLQRTELYEAERQAALELQRALLPVEVTGVPGWDLAAYYSPAGEQGAGGDFYDVVPVTGGFAAIIGDVMGRGVQAAAAMAQIRSTIRAYAIDDPDPVRVFSRVDTFFEALDVAQLVTVMYLLVDPDSGAVQLANAGHLPPLLVRDGGAEALPAPAGLPFGAGPDDRRAEPFQMQPGDALVIVTDGLVERRGEDIDRGLARVTTAASGSHGTAAQLMRRVLAAGGSSDLAHDDDVTVLVIHRT